MRSELVPSSVSELLEARRPELERAVLARVRGMADPAVIVDAEYADGLRAAVTGALGYGIAALADRVEDLPPVPSELLQQARAAARNGVSLDTVMRRYFAGYTLVGDFLVEEAERDAAILAKDLRRALRTESVLFDRLLVAVSTAYSRELEARNSDGERRRVRRVQMLLAGELLDTAALDYELDAWHLGAVGTGPGARVALRELGGALGRRQLVICAGGETVWAWFGGIRPLDSEDVRDAATVALGAEVCLAIGEPARGIEGWRATHRQAQAALPVARRGARRVVRYADVTLLASALRDEILAASLKDLYLDPLTREPDGGQVLCQALAAYFDADRQVAAAAAALGVSRQTVSARLRAVEERIGAALEACTAELETAFALRELGRWGPAGG